MVMGIRGLLLTQICSFNENYDAQIFDQMFSGKRSCEFHSLKCPSNSRFRLARFDSELRFRYFSTPVLHLRSHYWQVSVSPISH